MSKDSHVNVVNDVRKASRSNLSAADLVAGYFLYVRRLAAKVALYRKAYRNYLDVLYASRKRKYPVRVILCKNNCVLELNNLQLSFVASCQNHDEIEYSLEDDLVIIPVASFAEKSDLGHALPCSKVTLLGGTNNGDIISVFLHREFGSLPVPGRTVVDIVANIGDSAVYFAARGAARVISFEPLYKNYQLAAKNIKVNGLTDRVIVEQAGCSSFSCNIVIDPEKESNTVSQLSEFSGTGGMQVPLVTLDDIADRYEIEQGSILKIDCEGCEYDVILSASDSTLRKFSHMQIEYHYGYRNLEERLRRCGFSVSHTVPKSDPRPQYRNGNKMYVGMIYARQVE